MRSLLVILFLSLAIFSGQLSAEDITKTVIVVPAAEAEGHAYKIETNKDEFTVIGVIIYLGEFIFAEVKKDSGVWCGNFTSLRSSVRKCETDGLFLLVQDKTKFYRKYFKAAQDPKQLMYSEDDCISNSNQQLVKYYDNQPALYLPPKTKTNQNPKKLVGTYFGRDEKTWVFEDASGTKQISMQEVDRARLKDRLETLCVQMRDYSKEDRY